MFLIISHFNLLFFHNFYIFSLFIFPFFCIFPIFSLSNWIVKRYGKYGRKVSEMWNNMENMAEIPVE
jgi:hypothetical protein